MLPIAFAVLALLPAADDRAINDAPLYCVRFVDRNEGWAAGADGVMWHTIDGGASWERQPLPTKGTIHALQFLTPYTAFAAGREEVQATGKSAAVLLMTRDGGLTWTRVATNDLPGLLAVEFADERNGRVIGGGQCWRTRDCGRTWDGGDGGFRIAAEITGIKWTRLLGHFDRGPGCGMANAEERAELSPQWGARIMGVGTGKQIVVAVGQRGQIRISNDGIQAPEPIRVAGVRQDILASCDFHSAVCCGDQIWVTGAPGSLVLHSRDRGNNWQAKTTSSSTPLNGLFLLDDRQGWAVGELGTILSTNDGGESWKVQKRGGQRAAVMCINAQAKNTPLDLIASLGAADGYVVHSIAVSSRDDSFEQALRVATAIRKTGGATGEQYCGFDLPENVEKIDSDQLLMGWNSRYGTRATDVLTRRLVMQLRTWQPEVVICDFAGGPAETLVVEAVQAAVKQAADPNAFPEQIQVGKLAPCQVKKLFGLWDGPGSAHVTVRTSDPVPALGESPRDYANRVVGLIAEPASLPKQRGLRLLINNMPSGTGLNGIMDGIILAPGGTARRPAAEGVKAEKPVDDKALRELQNLVNVAQSGLPLVNDPTAVLAKIGQALDRLPTEQGLNAIMAMAQQVASNGNWPLAKETYELAAARYGAQPAGLEAIRWLMRYHSSSEARRRYELKQFVSPIRTEITTAFAKSESITIDGNTKPFGDSLAQDANKSMTDAAMVRQWYQQALALEPKLVALGPAATGDPAIQFALAAAKRQLGDADGGKGYFRRLLAEKGGDEAWRMAARQELWLADQTGPAPRFAAVCRKTVKRPHLDALFDDECWADLPIITAIPINGNMENHATSTRFAYDDEYLYIAIDCQHPEAEFRPKVERRTRDADVTTFDRVEILLNMDRNYGTYYRFRIDQRGALAEDCWGDSRWNPRWYVAFKSAPTGYAAEIAIHLHDLTGEAIVPGTAWAMNLLRIVPGKGLMAASSPADAEPRPEGCGLLLFADAASK
jgi:photosystem II stability/assembly factor-like uncharacterized protein